MNNSNVFDSIRNSTNATGSADLLKLAEQLFQSDSEKEKTRAVEYCLIVADQGNRDAQYRLGLAWEHGEGVPWPDDGQALAWYRKAAKQGHSKAKYKYAYCLHWGVGAPATDEEYDVDSWLYESACYAEDPDAAFMMAYYNYSYWWQNSEFATDWYRMAAEKGNGKAQYQLAKAVICDEQRKQIMNVDDAREEALSWLRQASGNGITAASYTLWQIYELGLWGMEVDHGLAKYWFAEKERNRVAHQEELSAKAEWRRKFGPNNPQGQYLRGVNALSTYGKNLPRYNPVALGWFHAAAAQGHVGAQNYLEGHAYEHAIPIDELLSWKDDFTGYMKVDNPEPDFYSDMIILASADDVEKWQNAVLLSRLKY